MKSRPNQLIKAGFKSDLNFRLKPGSDNIYVIDEPLHFYSQLLRKVVEVPVGFETDLASVPRIPIVFALWGGMVHREGVLHDYLFRIGIPFECTFSQANKVFLEAMKSRNKPFYIRWPIYSGVVIGGYPSYHKRNIDAIL